MNELSILARAAPTGAELYFTAGGMAVLVLNERGRTYLVTVGNTRCWVIGEHAQALEFCRNARCNWSLKQAKTVDSRLSNSTHDCYSGG